MFWPEDNYITFWEKDAYQQTKTGGQDGKYFHSYCELSRGADICWDKCDPDCTEYQHAESYQFGFIKTVWQLPSKKSKNETQQSKKSNITQHSPESNSK